MFGETSVKFLNSCTQFLSLIKSSRIWNVKDGN